MLKDIQLKKMTEKIDKEFSLESSVKKAFLEPQGFACQLSHYPINLHCPLDQ